MAGFTQIPNIVFDDDRWTSQVFTRGQAFADLYRLAQFKDGSVWKRGIEIKLKPGQISWSLASLGKRWKWSVGKVKRFLNSLKMDTQIDIQNTNVSSTITLLNWVKSDTADRTPNGHQTDTKQTPYNIDNIVNTENTPTVVSELDDDLTNSFVLNKKDQGIVSLWQLLTDDQDSSPTPIQWGWLRKATATTNINKLIACAEERKRKRDVGGIVCGVRNFLSGSFIDYSIDTNNNEITNLRKELG